VQTSLARKKGTPKWQAAEHDAAHRPEEDALPCRSWTIHLIWKADRSGGSIFMGAIWGASAGTIGAASGRK